MTLLRGLAPLALAVLVPAISFAQCPQGFTLTGGVCVAPSGGSTSPGGSPGAIQVNSAGAFGAANLSQNATDGSLLASKAINTAAGSAPTFNASGTTTVDWSLSNFAVITGTGTSASTTIAFSNPHGAGVYWLQTINPASPVSWTVAATGECFPTAAGASTLQSFAYNGATYQPGPCNSSVSGAFSAVEVGALTSTAGRGLGWFDSTAHLWAASNNASGTISYTTPAGTAGDIVNYSASGFAQDSGILQTAYARNNAANTFTTGPEDFTAVVLKQGSAPTTDVADAISNGLTGAGGSCPGSVCAEMIMTIPQVTLAGAATSGTVDGIHKTLIVNIGHDLTGNGSPTVTRKLHACSQALTGSFGTLSCGGTSSTLWTSAASSIVSVANLNDWEAFAITADSGGTAGQFEIQLMARTQVLSQNPTGKSQQAACAACTGGAWTLYYGVAFSAAGTLTAACSNANTTGTNCISDNQAWLDYKF